jgi:hypothetical protein
MKDMFTINFSAQEGSLKGRAEIDILQEDDESIYLVRNIRFDNTEEEMLESGLVEEPELRLRRFYDDAGGRAHWLEADSDDETEIARLIGQAIEKKTDTTAQ